MSCNKKTLLYSSEVTESAENLDQIQKLSTTQVCIADLGEREGSGPQPEPRWTPSSFISSNGKLSCLSVRYVATRGLKTF